MKTNKNTKKFNLNKSTITALNQEEKNAVNGGLLMTKDKGTCLCIPTVNGVNLMTKNNGTCLCVTTL